MNAQPTARYPATWEANLLSAGLFIILVITSAILTLILPLAAVLVVGQILFAVPALLWMLVRRLPLRDTIRLHPISPRTALWGAVIGITAWPVVSGMSALFERPLSQIGPYPGIPLPATLIESLAYAFTFVVLAPLTEEPIYRGFILRAWLRRGARAGIIVSGVLFGLVHSQIAPVIPLILLGVVFGLISYRTRSVLTTVVAHASYNAAATLFVVIPPLQETQEAFFMVAGAIALPIAAFVVWAFLRRHPAPAAELPPSEDTVWWKPAISFLVVVGLFGLMAILEIVLRLNPNLPAL